MVLLVLLELPSGYNVLDPGDMDRHPRYVTITNTGQTISSPAYGWLGNVSPSGRRVVKKTQARFDVLGGGLMGNGYFVEYDDGSLGIEGMPSGYNEVYLNDMYNFTYSYPQSITISTGASQDLRNSAEVLEKKLISAYDSQGRKLSDKVEMTLYDNGTITFENTPQGYMPDRGSDRTFNIDRITVLTYDEYHEKYFGSDGSSGGSGSGGSSTSNNTVEAEVANDDSYGISGFPSYTIESVQGANAYYVTYDANSLPVINGQTIYKKYVNNDNGLVGYYDSMGNLLFTGRKSNYGGMINDMPDTIYVDGDWSWAQPDPLESTNNESVKLWNITDKQKYDKAKAEIGNSIAVSLSALRSRYDGSWSHASGSNLIVWRLGKYDPVMFYFDKTVNK